MLSLLPNSFSAKCLYRIAIVAIALTSCTPSTEQKVASLKEKASRIQLEKKYRKPYLRALEGQKRFQADHALSTLVRPFELNQPRKEIPHHRIDQSPPDFDALHYRIALQFPAESLKSPQFNGEVDLTFKPLKDNYQLLQLDSAGLEILKITLINEMEDLQFQTRGEKVEVDLGSLYNRADELTLRVQYKWNGQSYNGIFFTSREGHEETETLFSQSEPELSKYWFPGNARPNDRATFEALIEVPKPFVAVSNGALKQVEDLPGERRLYHWKMEHDMVSYLFVVTAGKYDEIKDHWRDVPLTYYGMPDDLDRLQYSLRNTPLMMEFFSEVTGFPYPYEKYAQAVVAQYQWGGMEHTTATTLTDQTLHGPNEDEQFSSDGLVMHELAHQWFGDLATCKDWSHLWLNEGFATYGDALFTEAQHGEDALLEQLASGASWYFWEEMTYSRPIVFPYYRDSLEDYFDSRSYPKGAWVLHMLRNLVGDEIFFRGLRTYIQRYAHSLVETQNLVDVFEEVSQSELSWFFDQWLYHPGHPVFDIQYSWDAKKKETLIRVKQLQDTSQPGGVQGFTPYFMGPMPIEINGRIYQVNLAGIAEQTLLLPMEAAPQYLHFNSKNAWLARVTTHQTLAAWKNQILQSTDVTALVSAAQALGELPLENLGKVENIVSTLGACSQLRKELWARRTCLESLQQVLVASKEQLEKNLPAIEAMIWEVTQELAGSSQWQIRSSLAGLYSVMRTPLALQRLINFAQHDPAVRVREAATRSLGQDHFGNENYDVLVDLLEEKQSFHGLVQGAALEALGKIKDLKSLSLGITYSDKSQLEAIRKGAFSLLVELGLTYGFQPNHTEILRTVRETLVENLSDPSYRIRKALIGELVRLGDSQAIPALLEVAQKDPDGRIRKEARLAVEKLEKTQWF